MRRLTGFLLALAVAFAQGQTRYKGVVLSTPYPALTVKAGEVVNLPLALKNYGLPPQLTRLRVEGAPADWAVALLGNGSAVKRRVGYLPDSVGFYEDLSGRENLRYTAALNGMGGPGVDARIDEALASMGMTDAADRPVRTYSRGMKQRLGLADVLLKEPQLVILDEPTLGLDPQAAHEFLGLIRSPRSSLLLVFWFRSWPLRWASMRSTASTSGVPWDGCWPNRSTATRSSSASTWRGSQRWDWCYWRPGC